MSTASLPPARCCAVDDASAMVIAKSVANSPLVKTAIAGEDANWGRIAGAVGRAGVQLDPDKIDVYFDNVGGEILDAALARLRMHARVVICGAISQYNNTTAIKGPSNYLSLLVNRATMQGMVVMDYAKDYATAAMQMGQWMMEGKLKSKEDIYNGIENFHETFQRLFSGDKKGKLILKVIE